MDACRPVRNETKMEVVHFTRKQLAARWHLSEATLERWHCEGLGPKLVKLPSRVLYRLCDIEAFEEACFSNKHLRQVSEA